MDAIEMFLAQEFLGKVAWLWLSFVGIVAVLLAFDLGVLHRNDRVIGIRDSITLLIGYIALALLYGAWVWWYLGANSGMEYLTGLMIEKTLAIDNVFVIAMIFTYFAIPLAYQYRVLFWGGPRGDFDARSDDRPRTRKSLAASTAAESRSGT